VHWVWVKGRGYTDQNGRVVLVSGVIMDIDERKPAEERYRLQATALQEAANAVVLTDHKGTNLYVHPAFEQMTAYRANEVFVNRKKDGSLYTEEMTVAPVRSENGDISYFVAIKQDITEQK